GWAADWPSAAAAAMFFWISWGEADGFPRAICAGILGPVALARFGLGVAFRRSSIEVARAIPWQRGYLAATLPCAAAWGVLGSTLFSPDDPAAAALPCLLMAGVAALALPLLSASVTYYFPFLALVLIPCTLRLLFGTGRPGVMPLVLLVFAAS